MTHRTFIIYFNSAMIACTLAAIVATLLLTREPLNCVPLVLVFIMLMRTNRYCLLWSCKPEHLAKIRPEREPLAMAICSLLQSFINRCDQNKRPRILDDGEEDLNATEDDDKRRVA